MSYEISLAKVLENRDLELYGRLLKIRKDAEPLLSYTHGNFPYYTPHGFSHSTNVEENLNWLVPDPIKEKMKTYELFFLIIAAWLHDWGMVGEDGDNAEAIREEHHIRTEANFEKHHTKLDLSEHEARIIGRICKGHRKVDLNTPDYDDVVFGQDIRIRRRFLSALLRIADECDITHNRTPEIIYYSINPKGESESEFKKHLSISGIGQLEEKHKIYISAIARDPRGARTLREVTQKIQRELDAVKGVLAQNEVILDLVELRLETRGFIDKPIAFEIDRNKIVDLLIGDHLYAHSDVAIRELVQNSIDSCKLRESLDPNSSCKISLHRDRNNTLVIDDNGLGMDYYEAKHFLSTIGSSFYNSQLFQEKFGGKNYSPIAQYGIGILSCFLICNKITIETRKEGQEACKFSVLSINEEWKYEKGSMRNVGTKITLELNEDGRRMKLEDSLRRYFLCPEIPIEYKDRDGKPRILDSTWAADQIYQRFIREHHSGLEVRYTEILNVSRTNYDLIFCTSTGWPFEQLVLFNHGIYVGNFTIAGFQYDYSVCVNLKTNLVDLHISREDVKENAKWSAFILLLFNDIFHSLGERCGSSNKAEFISLISRMVEYRATYEVDSEAEFLDTYPFIKSFLENASFPIVSSGEVSFTDLKDALTGDELSIYNCCSRSLSEELSFISRLSRVTSLVVNPYNLPFVRDKQKKGDDVGLLEFLLVERGKRHTELDLRQILISHSVEVDIHYPELLPDNVRLATFAKGVKPLVVVYRDPVVEKHEHSLGSSYWGNILLWKELLERKRMDSYLDTTRSFLDDRFDKIRIIDEPVVYVDSADTFIRSLLDKRQSGCFDSQVSKKVQKYFKYLSYLPLVIHNIESCMIFLEVIDTLEAEIADSLKLKCPLQLFRRMKPDSKLFLDYFYRFGLKYMERQDCTTSQST